MPCRRAVKGVKLEFGVETEKNEGSNCSPRLFMR
jgi:hypothetical protein